MNWHLSFTDPIKGKYGKQGLLHSLDVWHCAKNLGKKLNTVEYIEYNIVIRGL